MGAQDATKDELLLDSAKARPDEVASPGKASPEKQPKKKLKKSSRKTAPLVAPPERPQTPKQPAMKKLPQAPHPQEPEEPVRPQTPQKVEVKEKAPIFRVFENPNLIVPDVDKSIKAIRNVTGKGKKKKRRGQPKALHTEQSNILSDVQEVPGHEESNLDSARDINPKFKPDVDDDDDDWEKEFRE